MREELKEYEDKMQERIKTLETELSRIRVGRANPNVLDNVFVDYYGQLTPINQVANISVPEAKVLLIQPWEKTMLKEVERAIHASSVGISPNNDGTSIRLVFPDLTEERRKDVAKDVGNLAEQAKISIRSIRKEAIDEYKGLENEGDIPEDYYFSMEGEIQKMTNEYTEKIDKVLEAKREEIMSI